MPYQRRYKRRYQKRPKNDRIGTVAKRNPQTSFNWAGAGNLALKMAGKALSLINAEEKIIDITTTLSPSTTPTLTLLNGNTQGTGNSNRVGNSLKISQNYLQMTFASNAAGPLAHIKWAIVLDKQPNGVVATANDIYEVGNLTVSPRNIDKSKRFKVLCNGHVLLGTDGTGSKKFVECYDKMSIHTEYFGNAGTIADISTNALYLYVLGDGVSNLPALTFYNRVRFLDN